MTRPTLVIVKVFLFITFHLKIQELEAFVVDSNSENTFSDLTTSTTNELANHPNNSHSTYPDDRSNTNDTSHSSSAWKSEDHDVIEIPYKSNNVTVENDRLAFLQSKMLSYQNKWMKMMQESDHFKNSNEKSKSAGGRRRLAPAPRSNRLPLIHKQLRPQARGVRERPTKGRHTKDQLQPAEVDKSCGMHNLGKKYNVFL